MKVKNTPLTVEEHEKKALEAIEIAEKRHAAPTQGVKKKESKGGK